MKMLTKNIETIDKYAVAALLICEVTAWIVHSESPVKATAEAAKPAFFVLLFCVFMGCSCFCLRFRVAVSSSGAEKHHA